MTTAQTMVKLINVTKILEAANYLKSMGVLEVEPASLVKKYVLANPDINELIAKLPQGE
jgi:hypothetical protein